MNEEEIKTEFAKAMEVGLEMEYETFKKYYIEDKKEEEDK